MLPFMRVVVTGGAGYVGSVLVRQLLADGHEVHVLDNLTFGGHSMMPLFIDPMFSFANVDVRDRAALSKELQGADAVIHLAALVGYPLCKKMPDQAQEINVGGTTNVIECMPDDARLIYASTGSNYGEVEGICTEISGTVGRSESTVRLLNFGIGRVLLDLQKTVVIQVHLL